MSNAGLADAAADHAALLMLCARTFLSPDQPELSRLLARARQTGLLERQAPERVAEVEESLRGDPLNLAREYTRLFLDPAGAPCPPWQSVYDEEPQLMGSAHYKALSWCRRYGLQPRLDNEPADHIGLLLAFYAHLLREGAPPTDLDAFHHDHLGWIPRYCELLLQHARHPLFRFAASLTAELIQSTPYMASDPA
jgi:TorA maturation chaperone TorD